MERTSEECNKRAMRAQVAPRQQLNQDTNLRQRPLVRTFSEVAPGGGGSDGGGLAAQPPHSHYIDPGRVLPGLPRRAAGGKPRRTAGGKAPQGENFRDCGRSTKAKWP